METIRATEVPKLAPRPTEGHKGDFGRVLVVGGSRAMIGAPALAALSALRGGAGLVSAAVPACIQPHVLTICPCATSVSLACEADAISMDAVAQVLAEAERNDVLAVGPGMGVGLAQQMLIRGVLEQERPVVLDADGLNNLPHIPDWPQLRRCPLVLTPHPGEMARLTGRPIQDIQADREGAAMAAMRDWADQVTIEQTPLVLVLKGAGTVVTDGRRVYVNDTGNPGMATGGAGDVLTGLIAALIGQKIEPFDAAVLGVYLHGLAGDIAAERTGQVSLIATDIIDALGKAFGGFMKGG